MDQYELIRTASRVYGKSIHQIVREYGHSRNTVRKALRGFSPEYVREKVVVSPVMDPFREVIESWLRTDLQMPKKQRHTAHRIYSRLVEEYGFRGAESTVRRYVRKLKIDLGIWGKEAFVPLDATVGKEAEVDWGQAQVIMNGERMKVELFCMRSKYSGKDFVRAYPHARQEAFFDGHIQAFAHYGGVFGRLIYDNLRTAVIKVLRGKARIEQEAFIRFRSYYTFEAHFCNPGRGNEKGGVEGLVGYARRNYLVPLPEVDSFEALNALLLSRCLSHDSHRISGQAERVGERFEAERPLLLSVPESAYPVKKQLENKVDHYSTVKVDCNRYSVPTDYCGLKVNIELGVDRVCIYYERKLIGDHLRTFGKNKWQLDPFHYLKLLARKPQAFDSARPIRSWRSTWPASYERLLAQFREKNSQGRGTKEFIKVLMLLGSYSKESVEKAIDKALVLRLSDAAAIKTLLDYPLKAERDIEQLAVDAFPQLTDYQVLPPDLECYGILLQGGER